MTQTSHVIQFQHEKTALKYYLIGRGFNLAIKALGYAERHTVGVRKDGKTPEFHHQVQIAMAVMHLKGLLSEEMCIVVALLHDIMEDYHISREELSAEFGAEVARLVWGMTKKFRGEHKTSQEYFTDLALDPILSITKGLDRCHNLRHMVDAFTVDKQLDYTEESEKQHLPMLKRAARLFPEQQSAYMAIILEMKYLIKSTRKYVEAVKLAETERVKREDLTISSQFATIDAEERIRSSGVFFTREEFSDLLLKHQREIESAKRNSAFISGNCDTAIKKQLFRELIVEIEKLDDHGWDGHWRTQSSEVIHRFKQDLFEKIRPIFGVSELELTSFNETLISGPIPAE
jgi:hypothetical protein